jgi:hypothetical protein
MKEGKRLRRWEGERIKQGTILGSRKQKSAVKDLLEQRISNPEVDKY